MMAYAGERVLWAHFLRFSELEPCKRGEGHAGSLAASLKEGVSVEESVSAGLLDSSTPHVVASN